MIKTKLFEKKILNLKINIFKNYYLKFIIANFYYTPNFKY